MPDTDRLLPLSADARRVQVARQAADVQASPLLTPELPSLVKVLGLMVIVPPANSPQLIACTTVPPESTSMPLTSGQSAAP